MRGVTVTLYEQTVNGHDPFGAPIYTETVTQVPDVLVGEPSTEDITTTTQLYGKTLVCMLGIPKGDSHDWENRRVDFFGERWRVFGVPTKGIEELIPLDWNAKVTVERYE